MCRPIRVGRLPDHEKEQGEYAQVKDDSRHCCVSSRGLGACDNTSRGPLSRARMLEEASYDLALGIIRLEIQDGETEQVLLAPAKLHHMDEHLAWVDYHRCHVSHSQLLTEVDQARIHASHILEVLRIP